MKENAQMNPLVCDIEKGICENPGSTSKTYIKNIEAKQKPVRIIYFTDPICSSCWGIEPQLRKLKLEYGDFIDIEYRMGGLLPSWDIYNSNGISNPSDVAHHWDEVSAYYEMPIDGDIWLEDPLQSSYPPSVAFKAAQIQDKDKAILFLRRIREMVFLEKKNITKWEHLEKAAKEVSLDTTQLKADCESKARQLFQADLDFARKLGVRGFPTLFFTDTLNNQVLVYGFKPYETFENAVTKLLPQAKKKQIGTSWESMFNHYTSMTTKEFSVLTNQTIQQTEVQLKNLYLQNKLTAFTIKNGTLWKRQ
ncbi:MAG: DsbA family protein [Candidatus Omnitrophica bacterium]|nr:DsbA family protein [Candidatus Omnitrophota bacterium]